MECCHVFLSHLDFSSKACIDRLSTSFRVEGDVLYLEAGPSQRPSVEFLKGFAFFMQFLIGFQGSESAVLNCQVLSFASLDRVEIFFE